VFELYKFNEAEIIAAGLMLIRIATFMAIMPLFGTRVVPQPAKILLSMVMTLVLFPVLKNTMNVPAFWDESLILCVLREAFIGIFLGFLTRMIFMSVEVAGQLVGISMGFSTITLINPAFGDSAGVMEQFESILATLLFLAINGHHLFFEAIFQSFKLAPVGVLTMNPQALASLTVFAQEVFVIGVKLAGPMIAVILFLNVALGIVGRAVPQINVFVISFPVNILVGLFVFMVSIPLMLTVMESDFMQLGGQMFAFLKGF
jgi:flagellar biosynthesis protein FliR